MRTNPLIVLAIPKAVLVHLDSQNRLETILEIAKASYKAQSRVLHPDQEGGDEGLMTSLSDAIKELRDPDVLRYYVSEIVGEVDLAAIRRKDVIEANRLDLEATAHNLTKSLQFVDQFQLLKITRPTTYLAIFGGTRLVIDVVSPSKTRIKVVAESIGQYLGPEGGGCDFQNGSWSELALKSARARKSTRLIFDEFSSRQEVRLIGYSPAGLIRADARESISVSLEASVFEPVVDWVSPASAWFLPMLSQDRTELHRAGFVACKGGHVAQLGELLGSAPL